MSIVRTPKFPFSTVATIHYILPWQRTLNFELVVLIVIHVRGVWADDNLISLLHWCTANTDILTHTIFTTRITNPSSAKTIFSKSKTMQRFFWTPSKPCHVGIHWIAIAEYSQMSTHMPWFQSFFKGFLHHFILAKFATSSIRANIALPCLYVWPWASGVWTTPCPSAG